MNDLRIRGHDDYWNRNPETPRARGQDDGFSLWPIFPTHAQPSVNNLLSSPATPPVHPPAQDAREGSGDMTLAPIRVATLRRLEPGLGPGPPSGQDMDMDHKPKPEPGGDRRGPSR